MERTKAVAFQVLDESSLPIYPSIAMLNLALRQGQAPRDRSRFHGSPPRARKQLGPKHPWGPRSSAGPLYALKMAALSGEKLAREYEAMAEAIERLANLSDDIDRLPSGAKVLRLPVQQCGHRTDQAICGKGLRQDRAVWPAAQDGSRHGVPIGRAKEEGNTS